MSNSRVCGAWLLMFFHYSLSRVSWTVAGLRPIKSVAWKFWTQESGHFFLNVDHDRDLAQFFDEARGLAPQPLVLFSDWIALRFGAVLLAVNTSRTARYDKMSRAE